MPRILKEPLVHFLLLGVALFFISGWLDPKSEPGSDREIVVSVGRIEQLSALFAKTWQRPPNEKELKSLIDDFVLEEIYYREAVAMGIDQNDTIIRRRMRQKMEFLTEDIAAQAKPSDDALKAFLAENESEFRSDPSYTFRQLYFNPEKHGDDLVAFVRTQADELRAGVEVEGDRTLLQGAFENASRRDIDATFGAGLAEKFEALETGQWSDPIKSGLGLHLVLIESWTPGKLPEFDVVRPKLEREWTHRNRNEMRQQLNDELLKKYDVVIDPLKSGEETGGEGK